MKEEMTSHSESETLELGRRLGASAAPGTVYGLYGELGTGKTILAKGIALGLGITEDITSPTFTLLEIYPGPLPLYHFDLYRIEDPREFDNLGFDEYLEGDGVSVIEWADRAGSALPPETITVSISFLDGVTRKIAIEYPDN